MLTAEAIKQQSLAAYGQWCKQWREHAKIHSAFPMKPLSDFENIGIGKAILCIANGASFERNLETIKKYQGNVDILVCDKSLGPCLDHGIIPTYAVLCDANVSYEKYLEPWKDRLSNTILFSNVCANPKWTDKVNSWKDIYFFVNEDVLESEKEFTKLSGCKNTIAAATNVSNAMVVFLTQSNNDVGRRNYFGYDKILLIGFDYSWLSQGNYYAFNPDGNGKHHYMRHQYGKTLAGDLCYTSNNLAFSAKWLEKYISTFNLPVVQCSKDTILGTKYSGELSTQMQYKSDSEDSEIVRTMIAKRNELVAMAKKLESEVIAIGKKHFYSFVTSV